MVPLDFLAVCGYNHTKSRFSKSKKKAEFYYAFFSESGFDDKIVHDANENETALYNLETIVGFV